MASQCLFLNSLNIKEIEVRLFKNSTAVVLEIPYIVKVIFECFMKYRSGRETFRSIHYEYLYWIVRKVVTVMFRKDTIVDGATNDLDALQTTLTEIPL
ncbi:hypothetical protein DVH24_011720 [Malus domestica]|uniref:Uncharacterized protein n=1 Tax=Malus domestica TaxID=3750 RepID=A0A498JW30_MALDO|nr:hypothetical protein DVH24_011720 [Malus domestica]